MFGRSGTLWQVTVGIVGLAIVGIVFVSPRMRVGATMITAPAAVVAPNNGPLERVQTVVQATDPGPAAPAPAAPAPADPAPGAQTGVPAPAAGGAPARPAVPEVPATSAVPAVAGVSRTLLSDNFESNALSKALPAGWRLDDVVQSSQGGLVGSLPLLGGLLSSGGTTVSDLLPSLVADGGTTVLARKSGTWSHLSTGSSWGDLSVSADMKPAAGTGFVGVTGRVLDASNFLSCGLRDGSVLELVQVVGGRQQVLDSRQLTSTVSNAFHTVEMTMQGSSVSCSLDGASALLHGSSSSSLTTGRLGLVALGTLTSEFDNVRAIALP
jgi:hypothetical protein